MDSCILCDDKTEDVCMDCYEPICLECSFNLHDCVYQQRMAFLAYSEGYSKPITIPKHYWKQRMDHILTFFNCKGD